MYHVTLFSDIKFVHKDVTGFYEFLSLSLCPFVDESTAADGRICLTDLLQSDPLLQTPCVTFAMLGHTVFCTKAASCDTEKQICNYSHGGFS